MPTCPVCRTVYPVGDLYCPDHGAALIADGAPPAIPPPLGVTLNNGVLDGRYRLLARVGAGGVGTVYKAEHLWMQRTVAIKFLRREITTSEEAVKRFAREARLVSQIADPRCVSVFDFARTPDGTFYLVMEFITGKDLRALLIERKRLPILEAASIFEQVILGLGAAHKAGIVHRDIKPENLMVHRGDTNQITVKILDFGVARRWSAAAKSAELTQPGRTLGTPEYIAPEQALGHPIDGRADLYSVGCLLFEAVCGRRPYPAAEPVEMMRAHVTAPVPSARATTPEANISPALDAVIEKALAKDPAARYPDAQAFADALRRAVGGR
jgi:eukaryotic-like serine/threonine-protein kinase